MLKQLADFISQPKVYKPLALLLTGLLIYMNLIAPLMGQWSHRTPTMIDAHFFMRR
jgi:hypothetical protein